MPALEIKAHPSAKPLDMLFPLYKWRLRPFRRGMRALISIAAAKRRPVILLNPPMNWSDSNYFNWWKVKDIADGEVIFHRCVAINSFDVYRAAQRRADDE